MEFYEIKENKKQYLDLLLLADEQENMIDKYLERGSMFIIDKYDVKAVCIVTDEGCGIIEIKNIKKVGFDLQSYNLFANKTAFGKSG